jgi:antitoxin CptB
LAPSRNDEASDRFIADIQSIALYIRLARPVRAFGVELFTGFALGKSVGISTMTERSSEGLDERRRKLLFRAWRRGVRETDLIVGRFADAYIDKFDDAGLDDFERLIEAPNAELYAWVVGTETVPASYDTAVLAKLKEFHLQKIHLQKSQSRAEEGR